MPGRLYAAAFLLVAAPVCVCAQATNLVDLSLEQLSNTVVTSVSRRAEPLGRAAASVFVISGEDIRRAGARTIQEALRLAPNLQVARASAGGYAITARGFNQTLANKLLVLIDGRTVYTPLFAGVFWEAQDVLLEDVDRIEVISGPGGTLWGTNAVNGVVNILTKNAARTQGALIAAGSGQEATEVDGRYGGALGSAFYRAYAKADRVENAWRPNGQAFSDGSRRKQAGFRTDWATGSDTFTVQGDSYKDKGEQPQVLEGVNVLGRWSRALDADASVTLQAYYDQTSRRQQVLKTADVEATHTRRLGSHRLLMGGGLRQYRDRIDNSAAIAVIPAEQNLTTSQAFLQDEIALRQDLTLAAGLKLERNDYTGTEWLPGVRLGWDLSERHFLWAAWSRAVRSPSRFDRGLFLPGNPPYVLAGGPTFESEVSNVYELGYRGQPSQVLSWSATAFYDNLKKLRSVSPAAGGAQVTNHRLARTVGIEGWGTLRVLDAWRLQAGYTRLHTRLGLEPGTVDVQPLSDIASDPEQWWTLRSAHDLGANWELDVLVRHVGAIQNRGVPAYTAADARVGWRVSSHVELSLLLRNLFDRRHVEWGPGAAELRRTFFVSVRVSGG